jgi:predicted transcriptional regulator
MEESRQPVQITTRVEPELADRLTAIAAAERRSLSNLLVLAVEQFVTNYEARLTQGS